MNTPQRATHFNSTFWLMGLVLLAVLLLYLLLTANQTASQQQRVSKEHLQPKVLTKPAIVEKVTPKDLALRKWNVKQAPEPNLLPKPSQLEKYKPNEP